MSIIADATYTMTQLGLEEQKCNSNSIREEGENIVQSELHFYKERFIADFYSMSYANLLEKYRLTYPIFESTILPPADENQPIITLPDECIVLKRRIYKDPVYDENGKVKAYAERVRKLNNGEHRRKHLYLNAILRRKMKEDIDLCHLLFCLVHELYHYVWNNDADDTITKQELFRIAERAMQTDLAKYQPYFEKHRDKRKCMANPDFCVLYDVNPRTAVNYGRSAQSRKRFAELYDPNLSQAENLKRMNDAGLEMSLRTFKTRCRELGFTKYKKRTPECAQNNQRVN